MTVLVHLLYGKNVLGGVYVIIIAMLINLCYVNSHCLDVTVPDPANVKFPLAVIQKESEVSRFTFTVL